MAVETRKDKEMKKKMDANGTPPGEEQPKNPTANAAKPKSTRVNKPPQDNSTENGESPAAAASTSTPNVEEVDNDSTAGDGATKVTNVEKAGNDAAGDGATKVTLKITSKDDAAPAKLKEQVTTAEVSEKVTPDKQPVDMMSLFATLNPADKAKQLAELLRQTAQDEEIKKSLLDSDVMKDIEEAASNVGNLRKNKAAEERERKLREQERKNKQRRIAQTEGRIRDYLPSGCIDQYGYYSPSANEEEHYDMFSYDPIDISDSNIPGNTEDDHYFRPPLKVARVEAHYEASYDKEGKLDGTSVPRILRKLGFPV